MEEEWARLEKAIFEKAEEYVNWCTDDVPCFEDEVKCYARKIKHYAHKMKYYAEKIEEIQDTEQSKESILIKLLTKAEENLKQADELQAKATIRLNEAENRRELASMHLKEAWKNIATANLNTKGIPLSNQSSFAHHRVPIFNKFDNAPERNEWNLFAKDILFSTLKSHDVKKNQEITSVTRLDIKLTSGTSEIVMLLVIIYALWKLINVGERLLLAISSLRDRLALLTR